MGKPDEGCERAAPHLREVALFLSVHLGRAPGVLWPEHDHPVFGDDGDGAGPDEAAGPGGSGARATRLDRFNAELGTLTGLSVRAVGVHAEAGDAGDPGRRGAGPDAVSDRDHLLIHQMTGAGTWRLAGSGEDGRPGAFQCRLLPGEVLYVPARWSHRAECTPRARYAVIALRQQSA